MRPRCLKLRGGAEVASPRWGPRGIDLSTVMFEDQPSTPHCGQHHPLNASCMRELPPCVGYVWGPAVGTKQCHANSHRSAYSAWNHPRSPQFRQNPARTRPTVARLRPTSTQIGPDPARIGPHSTNPGPISARNHPDSAKVGRTSTELGQISATNCRFGPNLAQNRRTLAWIRPELGWIRPNLEESTGFDQNSPEFVQVWPLAGIGPNLARSRSPLTRT